MFDCIVKHIFSSLCDAHVCLMAAPSRKVLAVCGATGSQGGAVVEAAVADGSFIVRALVRNPESEKAQRLAERGVDVVKADFDDLGSLKTGLSGASMQL